MEMHNDFSGSALKFYNGEKHGSRFLDFVTNGGQIEKKCLIDFLLFGTVLPPYSPVVGVKSLFPGEHITEGESESDYEKLDCKVKNEPVEFFVAELDRMFSEYYGRLKEKNKAVLLSGGIDSALIASYLGKEASALTWGGWGEQSTDVLFSRETRKAFGLREHHFIYADDEADNREYKFSVEELGIPILFGNAVPHMRLARVAKELGITSWFMGQNADTVLVSYPAPILIRRFIKLNSLLPLALLLAPLFGRKGHLLSTKSVVRQFAFFKSSGIFPGPWIKIPPGYFEEKEELLAEFIKRGNLMQRIILTEEILTETRRNQICQGDVPLLYGVESLRPYYTKEFVEFGLTLPDRLRRKDHYGKAVFKEFAKKRGVPQSVIEKGKKGLSYGYKKFMAERKHVPTWDSMEKDGILNSVIDVRMIRRAHEGNFLTFDALRSLSLWGKWVAEKRGLKLDS